MEQEVFICTCTSLEHQFAISYLPGDKDKDLLPNLFLSVHLSSCLPWYKRVWQGIKYVLGYRCKYGDFDEVWFQNEDVWRLKSILNEYISELTKQEKEVEEKR